MRIIFQPTVSDGDSRQISTPVAPGGRLVPRWLIAVGLLGLITSTVSSQETQFSAEELTFFEAKVRPILAERCYGCHADSRGKSKGGLVLDSREGAVRGGDSGPAAVPGQPDASPLITAVRYADEALQMPPDGKLPAGEIEILTEWVRRGLPHPPAAAPQNQPRGGANQVESHWAFQPLAAGQDMRAWNGVAPPSGEWANWPRRRIDSFVLAGQLRAGLHPSLEASRASWLRRVKLDLLGLPPTQEEIQAFVADPRPNAFELQVDVYLASPHYGERWGRHWLDLVRYCDVPEVWREGTAQAWLYRDWVIRALNEDLPFTQFVRKQLAADLLPDAVPTDRAALGLLGLSPTYWKELKLDHLVIKQIVAEEWEERLEMLGGTFLGLTLSCARCHDHKYDPITMRDYYALAGVLASIRLEPCSLLPPAMAAAVAKAKAQVADLEKQLQPLTAQKEANDETKRRIEELKGEVARIRRETPGMDSPDAFGVVEASLEVAPDGPSRTKLVYHDGQAQDAPLHIRGNAAKPGTTIPRGFIRVLSTGGEPRDFRQGSGRLELADAILNDAGPLAVRVFVNRIWRHHFGRGLVATVSNFGLQGERPSHPELLDDLAARFLEQGSSVKWLHRELVLSATYRQSSLPTAGSSDPDNIWLARMPLRRLEVEAWRDAILQATGELDSRLGGPSADLANAANCRRTVYGTVKRRELSDVLRLYDFPDPVSHVPGREPTMTPLQQLFVLNSPFLWERSRALAGRVASAAAEDSARVELLTAWVWGRAPSEAERTELLAFLSEAQQETSREEAWIQLAQLILSTSELLFVD